MFKKEILIEPQCEQGEKPINYAVIKYTLFGILLYQITYRNFVKDVSSLYETLF